MRVFYDWVIEIPTPRGSAFVQKAFKVAVDPSVPTTTQDRAITSPIWYTP